MNSAIADSTQEPLAASSGRASTATTVVAPKRNVAVDAYRGLVMLLMMGEVMQWAAVSHAYPHSLFWRILAFNQTHVEWAGMSLHDTIQPGFTFLVGVAMPYSIASRIRKARTLAAWSRMPSGGLCCWLRLESSCAPRRVP